MIYHDDFERFAHDIINVVQGTGRNGTAQRWQIDKVAEMLRAGPGITTWPRDAAEAAQRARDKLLKRPPLMPVMQRPVPTMVSIKPPAILLAPPKKP